MLIEDVLANKLIRVRESRKWTVYEACKRSHFLLPNTLVTLEGRNPHRPSAGEGCTLRTALDIIELYWPDVALRDFFSEGFPFDLAMEKTR